MRPITPLLFTLLLTAPLQALEVCVWRDEFNGTTLDDRHWTPETGFVRNVNARQIYTPENIALAEGTLVLTAKNETGVNPRYLWNSPDWRRNRHAAPYTSASVNSMGKVAMRYGRLEVRARFAYGRGIWPAIWLLGTPKGTAAPKDSDDLHGYTTALPWPQCGEIDVFEYASQTPTLTHATLHYGDHWEGTHYKVTGKTLACPTLADGSWHTYGLTWSADKLDLTFDGAIVHSASPAGLTNPVTGLKPFRDNLFHVILNLALGSMSEEPAAEDYPRAFEIDHIRLYQDPATPGNRIEIHNENRAFTALSSNDPATQAVAPDCAAINTDRSLAIGGQPLLIGGFTASQQFTLTLDATVPAGEGTIIGFKTGGHTIQFERFGAAASCRYDGANASLAADTPLLPGRHTLTLAYDCSTGTTIWIDHTPFYSSEKLRWGGTTVSLITLGATATGDRPMNGLVIHRAHLQTGSAPKSIPPPFPFACHDPAATLAIPADAAINPDGSLTLGPTPLTLTGLSSTQALLTLDADLPPAPGPLIAIHATQAPATPYTIAMNRTATGCQVADTFKGATTPRAAFTGAPRRFRLNYSASSGTAYAFDHSPPATLPAIKYSNSTLSGMSIGYPGLTIRGLALLTTAWNTPGAAQTIPLDASPLPDGSLLLGQAPLTLTGLPPSQFLTARLLAEIPPAPTGTLLGVGVMKGATPYTFQAEYIDPHTFAVRHTGTTPGGTALATPAPGIHAFTLAYDSKNAATYGTHLTADSHPCVDAPGVVWSGSTLATLTAGPLPGLRLIRLSTATASADIAADPLAPWTFPPALAETSTAVKASLIGHTGAPPGLVALPPATLNDRPLPEADAALALHLFGQPHIRFGLSAFSPTPPALTLASSADINGALTLLGATAPGAPWKTLATIPAPTLADGTYTLTPPETDCAFFKLRAEESTATLLSPPPQDPILHTTQGLLRLHTLTLDHPTQSLTFTLSGAALTPGQTYTLLAPGQAFTATLKPGATLTFPNLSPLPAGTTLTLALTRAPGDPPGDLAIGGAPVAHIATMIANTPKADGLATRNDQQYRIPALATDGNGHTLAVFDVRYGGADLGSGGIDLGESYSTDHGHTWPPPTLAVNVPNAFTPTGGTAPITPYTDIGDASLLYDPATDTYWLMAITGGGLAQPGPNHSNNDLALYTRANTPTAPWIPWTGGPPGNTRSIKARLIAQIGGLPDTGKGILAGPGHGITCRTGPMRGALVFPMQYFPNPANFTAQIFAAYTLDHGATWHTTALSSPADGDAQEGSIIELDDSSWLQIAKTSGNRRAIFRTADFTTWHRLTPHTPSTRVQGSALRIGQDPAGHSRYVMAFCTGGENDRSRLRLTFGRDITRHNPLPTQEGIAWDCGTLMIHASSTGGMGYNSLCLLDPRTLGILYEANKHIYFERIDLTPWLR